MDHDPDFHVPRTLRRWLHNLVRVGAPQVPKLNNRLRVIATNPKPNIIRCAQVLMIGVILLAFTDNLNVYSQDRTPPA